MRLMKTLRNAVNWIGVDVDRADGSVAQAVVLIDPASGLALGSAASPMPVQITGGQGADRELVVTTYRCKSAFTGATVGDTLTATRVLDVGGNTVTQVGITLWRNEATGADLATAPAASNVEVTGAPGLSDAQLRANPVPISNASGSPQNRSGTIASAGLAQPLFASRADRLTLYIFNPGGADLWFAVNGVTAAIGGAGSIRLPAYSGLGLSLPDPVQGAVSIICATSAQAFTAWES